ncbi:hypothetical protein CBS101457_003225 [Exobasidium rhododendri]|nr:hypothetical protein CBS101457_003225 [Exobasidium rhododendri]
MSAQFVLSAPLPMFGGGGGGGYNPNQMQGYGQGYGQMQGYGQGQGQMQGYGQGHGQGQEQSCAEDFFNAATATRQIDFGEILGQHLEGRVKELSRKMAPQQYAHDMQQYQNEQMAKEHRRQQLLAMEQQRMNYGMGQGMGQGMGYPGMGHPGMGGPSMGYPGMGGPGMGGPRPPMMGYGGGQGPPMRGPPAGYPRGPPQGMNPMQGQRGPPQAELESDEESVSSETWSAGKIARANAQMDREESSSRGKSKSKGKGIGGYLGLGKKKH